MLYISRTTIINFISLICLIKNEFEKVLICQRFNYFWRHVIAVFVYVLFLWNNIVMVTTISRFVI